MKDTSNRYTNTVKMIKLKIIHISLTKLLYNKKRLIWFSKFQFQFFIYFFFPLGILRWWHFKIIFFILFMCFFFIYLCWTRLLCEEWNRQDRPLSLIEFWNSFNWISFTSDDFEKNMVKCILSKWYKIITLFVWNSTLCTKLNSLNPQWKITFDYVFLFMFMCLKFILKKGGLQAEWDPLKKQNLFNPKIEASNCFVKICIVICLKTVAYKKFWQINNYINLAFFFSWSYFLL